MARSRRAPLEQRSARELLTVELEQVEHAVDDGVRGNEVCRRCPDPESLLQATERRLLPVECDDLAVE